MRQSLSGNNSNKMNMTGQMTYDTNAILEALPIAVYTCDLKGNITFYNQAAAALWGRKPLPGVDRWSGSSKTFHPDGTSLSAAEDSMKLTIKGGGSVCRNETLIERPDGVRLHVFTETRALFDEKGVLTGAMATLVNLDECSKNGQSLTAIQKDFGRQAQSLETTVEKRTADIRKSEERYHKMIDEVEDYAILLLDKEGMIMNWNKGAQKIKGYSEKEIVGQNFRIFYRERDRKDQLPEQLIQTAIESGKAMHEGWRRRKDGTEFWGNIVITALHDEHNNVIGFSKVTRDLTERKFLDDQLKNYAHELELQNKQLEEYAYVASHDLQEPLRKIKTFGNLLEKNIDDKSAINKYVDKINKSAERMQVLIRDVLRYAQLSRTHDDFVAIDLNDVIENIKDDFELLIREKHASISLTVLPAVKGIPIQMRQLFSNLLTNSFKFTEEAPVIEIDSHPVSQEEKARIPQLNHLNNYTRIRFKDNGIGFDQEYAEQIFKMFQRLSNTKDGTGIGLALCKKIAENHEGHITAFSQPGMGTTFDIYLPVFN